MLGCRALGAPGDVVHVTEGMGDHGLRVCALVEPIADCVNKKSPDQFGVGEKMQKNDEQISYDVDSAHDQYADLVERCPVNSCIVETKVYHNNVISHQPDHTKRQQRKHNRNGLSVFCPDWPRQPTRDGNQIYDNKDKRCDFCQIGGGFVVWADLCEGCVDDVEVEARREVAGGKGEEGEDHREVQFEVTIDYAVLGFDCVEVVVFEDVEKGEKTAVYPSPPLFHQIFVAFHRVCPRSSIGHVFEVVIAARLAVDA